MFRLYASIFFILLLVVSSIILSIVRRKHFKDPNYQSRLEERMAEAKRKQEEEEALEEYMYQSTMSVDE